MKFLRNFSLKHENMKNEIFTENRLADTKPKLFFEVLSLKDGRKITFCYCEWYRKYHKSGEKQIFRSGGIHKLDLGRFRHPILNSS